MRCPRSRSLTPTGSSSSIPRPAVVNPDDRSSAAPAHGLALATSDDAKLYVATDPDPAHRRRRADRDRRDRRRPRRRTARRLQTSDADAGSGDSDVAYDDATEMVHALGRTPDRHRGDDLRHRATRPAAVYADARLPFEPSAWVMDVARDDPTDDRSRSSPSTTAARSRASTSGSTSSPGGCPACWRAPRWPASSTCWPGSCSVAARSALLVALISFADGMFFVQSPDRHERRLCRAWDRRRVHALRGPLDWASGDIAARSGSPCL